VVVHWPSGIKQVLGNPLVDRYHVIVEPKR